MAQAPLGFGMMRLPVLHDGQIDLGQVQEMADLFLDNGFSYFDTSFVYHGGKSEETLRKAVVERHDRDRFTVATKFPTFSLQDESQIEGIFAQQLTNIGVDYIDYYLLHTLNRKFYHGLDGKGGVVKTCHLFDHARAWKAQGKIRHLGFSFHDGAELLDEILTDNPDVEFVQIILNYFDWDSRFIQSKACYDVIRAHGKQVVVMEPVKGGVLADHAAEALRFAAGKDGVLAVLSGMSNRAQMEENVRTMRDFQALTEAQERALLDGVHRQKEAGPMHKADFSAYEGLFFHGISVPALLETYNACMIQPNPNFAGELNYLANELLKLGITDIHQPFAPERVALQGEDITPKVQEAWDFLIAHSFVL